MKLKSFHETFRQDLQDPEFVVSYLQDCLDEGGTALFISALKDVVKVFLVSQEIQRQQECLLNDFIDDQDPTFFEIFHVLRVLDLDFRVQLQDHKRITAISASA
jgi:DNA-binding phage protein